MANNIDVRITSETLTTFSNNYYRGAMILFANVAAFQLIIVLSNTY